MSFGAALKQARESQGLTTQDVALRTKIRGDYLHALEDGNTSLLPERTFARSYLQRYARELSLDPAPLLYDFDWA
ncbi:helix-turn-helix domain-containing protein, partial [Deinococcus sp. 6YEL10]|uniref:helix-turn-helix domain-containing protein n=1 Tax=Deinococcus sp. 6YEL10 TaxID=2745870 RepID=UPI001E4E3D85